MFDPIPDEFASEKTEHMLYIWDFDVDHILSANASAVAAVVPDFDEIIETPLLTVDVVSCNCSNFPNTDSDKVLLPPLDVTTERRNSPEPTERNEDNLDGQNRNNSDDEHRFSDESEGYIIVCLYMF